MKKLLSKPIVTEEKIKCISLMKLRKASGLGGILAKLCKIFKNDLAPVGPNTDK